MTPKEQGRPKAHVSPIKKSRVSELEKLIKENKTILVASIKDIPANQFQEIVKKLRGKAVVKVPKKNLIFRAVDTSGIEEAKALKEKISDSVAILFSQLDAYDLAAELIKGKRPARAKPGQISPENIEIPEGPTELVPGPAITELGALGIQIQIDKGKIVIKKAKVVAEKGKAISKQASEIMGKLNIKPFSIGFLPLCAFDIEEKKLYSEISIDTEAAIKDLKQAYSKALAFAVEIGYPVEETITFLLGKAAAHERALSALVKDTPAESQAEAPAEEPKKPEEPKEEAPNEETKEEAKAEESKIENTGEKKNE